VNRRRLPLVVGASVVLWVLMLALLAVAVLYMGLYPEPFTQIMEDSVAGLLKHVALSKIPS